MRMAVIWQRHILVIRQGIVVAALRRLPPAAAEVRILASPGGEVGPFLDLFERVHASGERVVIDGPCLSACTLVLCDRAGRAHLRDAPRGARLPRRALDRPARPDLCRAGSLASGARRPIRAPVRGWISRHGGLTSRLLLLRGPRTGGDLSDVQVARRLCHRPVAEKAHLRRAAHSREGLRKLTLLNWRKPPLCPTLSRDGLAGDQDHIPSAGQLTIQGIPNWSTHMPKPLAQNVLLNGMLTLPPSASALNLRSASAGSSTCSETENPCG